MSWAALPATAAWTHSGAQTGFEVAWFAAADGGAILTGCTAATDERGAWAVDYEKAGPATRGARRQPRRLGARSGPRGRAPGPGLPVRGGPLSFDYAAPSEDFTARLVYDDAGLVLEYPGVATRSA